MNKCHKNSCRVALWPLVKQTTYFNRTVQKVYRPMNKQGMAIAVEHFTLLMSNHCRFLSLCNNLDVMVIYELHVLKYV